MAKGHDAMGKDGMMGETYGLTSTAVDLSKHVGHKVTVTVKAGGGMMDRHMMDHDMKDGSMKTLPVSSLPMIAATCKQRHGAPRLATG
ncbi:MAG: hypothetical protein AB7O28_15860 [Vicinamibacterales bacterium]